MAKISFQMMVGDATQFERTVELPDAHAGRFVSALIAHYDDGDPDTPALTETEALGRYTEGLVDGMKQIVTRVERDRALAQAEQSVDEIDVQTSVES